MSDYTPVYLPGDVITSTASATIVGGQPVEVTGSGTVGPAAPSATPSVKIIGVAADDTAVSGRVTLYGAGTVHESIADGTVTAGDQVVMATNAGRQVKTLAAAAIDVGATPTQASINTAVNAALSLGRAILGVAMTTASDNTKVRWMMTG